VTIDGIWKNNYGFPMGKIKLTIKDIAREAGVGLGTVSRVLNNSPHVCETTRDRVMEVVRSNQYQPSSAAARLARHEGATSTVGLLLPDISNHFFFEIFEIIYRQLRLQEIDLIIFNYEKHNRQVIHKVLNAEISALLIFDFQLDDTEIGLLKSRNVKYLYVDHRSSTDHCIYIDNVDGGRLAARSLLDKGVQRPSYIAYSPLSQSDRDRHAGFSQELARHGINSYPIYTAQLSEQSGYGIARQILTEQATDGIFCFCDDIAAGVLQAIREAQMPIRVVGFDGVRLTGHIGLSTISQHPMEIGTKAAQTIIRIMRETEHAENPIQLEIIPSLIDRNS